MTSNHPLTYTGRRELKEKNRTGRERKTVERLPPID
jgi:hypothetical protein